MKGILSIEVGNAVYGGQRTGGVWKLWIRVGETIHFYQLEASQRWNRNHGGIYQCAVATFETMEASQQSVSKRQRQTRTKPKKTGSRSPCWVFPFFIELIIPCCTRDGWQCWRACSSEIRKIHYQFRVFLVLVVFWKSLLTPTSNFHPRTMQ